MKKSLVLGFSVTLLISLNAFANQGTDSIPGMITCQAKNDSLTVTISANREILTVIRPGESKKVYRVSQSAGDTATWYEPKSGLPSLSFDDEGDYLTLNPSVDPAVNGVELDCPQGQ